jgi:hypothetical protein
MGFALELEREADELGQLLERIERLCADVRSRSQCLALVGATDWSAAQLARLLLQLEQPTGKP